MACGQSTEIREAAVNYLKTEATTKIELSNQYLSQNKDCPSRKESSRERLKEVEKLANVDASGFWMQEDVTMRQYRYYDAATCELMYPTGLTGNDIVRAASCALSIPELEEELRQIEDCENQLQILSQNIQVIEPLIPVWEADYKGWDVWESAEGVYIISGYGLGLHIKAPCIGQWYYYKTENKFCPADSYAEALFAEIAEGSAIRSETPDVRAIDDLRYGIDINREITKLELKIAYNCLRGENRRVVHAFYYLEYELQLRCFSDEGPIFSVYPR